jgi:hypothetical protein
MAYLKSRHPLSEMTEDEFTSEERASLPARAERRGGNGGLKAIVTILIVIIVVVAGWYGLAKFGVIKSTSSNNVAFVSNDWQAIFLVNGQVYFGKVKGISNKTLTLGDIYYLQVVSKPLQTTQQGNTADQQTQQELTLVKLGNELHGPSDYMIINRDQVVLTEKLKNDSKVVQAINDYIAKQKAENK